MRRYLRVYRSFVASSFQRELEFKANFFAKIGQNVVWLGFFAIVLAVVFSRTTAVAGWSRGESVVLGATVFVMGAVSTGLFFSLTEIPEQVRRGTLDFVLTRPVDSQFWVSLRRLAPEQVGVGLVGLGMALVGLHLDHLQPSLLQWAAWSVLLLCAVATFYSFQLALMTTSVWFVKVDNLFVLTETVQQVARYPLDIYGAVLARFLTFACRSACSARCPPARWSEASTRRRSGPRSRGRSWRSSSPASSGAWRYGATAARAGRPFGDLEPGEDGASLCSGRALPCV